MGNEKLVEQLKEKDFERDYDCTPFECSVFGLLDDAATALTTLQAKNERLRAELEKVTMERDAAVEQEAPASIGGGSMSPVDPVHAAGGIYCEECKMAVEDGGFLWCRGNEVKPTDFCSRGKQKDDVE